MGDEARHPTETLQDALDGRLDPVALAELNTHLSSCASCRLELEALRWAKEKAGSLKSFDEPADLDARLRAVLDEEDRARASSGARSRRLISWLAAAAALAAAVWIGGRLRTVSAPDSVASTYRAYASRALPLEIASAEPVEIERHLARALPFPTRVFDLGMMGFSSRAGGFERWRTERARSSRIARPMDASSSVRCTKAAFPICPLPSSGGRRRASRFRSTATGRST